jgi:hypothetical protein
MEKTSIGTLKKGSHSMSYIPGIIEQYEKLFGIIAIEKGFVSADDFVKALTVQAKENNKTNEQRFLREILLDQNIMSVEQICEVCDVIYHWIDGPVRNDDPPLIERTSRTLSPVQWASPRRNQ